MAAEAAEARGRWAVSALLLLLWLLHPAALVLANTEGARLSPPCSVCRWAV